MTIYTLIKTIALVISFIGYYIGVSFFLKKESQFSYIISASVITILLYVFGLVELLELGVACVFLAGLVSFFVFFVLYIRKRSLNDLLGAIWNVQSVFVILSVVWLGINTKGIGVSHWDDFTHWYGICKRMSIEGTLPFAPDERFPSYVPGTALWNFYVTRFIGFSSSRCFFAQGLLNSFACVNLFTCISWNKEKKGLISKLALLCLCGGCSIVLCAENVSTWALLVDTLIGLYALCGFIILMTYEERSIKTNYILLLIIAVQLALIKTSGLLFVLLLGILWAIKGNDKKKTTVMSTFLILIPLILNCLYLIRAKRLYGDLSKTGQGISLKRYSAVFLSRSGEDVKGIIIRFLKEITDFGRGLPQVKIVFICFAILGLLYLYYNKSDQISEIATFLLKTFKTILLLYTIWGLGLLVTYLFSIHKEEANANSLACLFRYMGTISIVITGLVFVCLTKLLVKYGKQKAFSLLMGVAILIYSSVTLFDCNYIWGYEHYVQYEYYTTEMWDMCTSLVPERLDPNDDSYVVVWNETDFHDEYKGKILYLFMMYLRTDNIELISVSEIANDSITKETIDMLDKCDYLIVFGDFSAYSDKIEKCFSIPEYKQGLIKLNN